MATAIDQYGETAESILGSALTGAVMVLFVNRDTGTWTLLTQRGDQLCIVDMGSGLKAVKPKGQDA